MWSVLHIREDGMLADRHEFVSGEAAHAQIVLDHLAELPVRHLPRQAGKSTGGTPRVLVRAFFELGRLWLSVRRFKPGTDFARAR